jgi:hypothetical protein
MSARTGAALPAIWYWHTTGGRIRVGRIVGQDEVVPWARGSYGGHWPVGSMTFEPEAQGTLPDS